MLIKGLSPGSLLRTQPEDRDLDRWSVQTELLAQLLEVTSVGVAERTLKKPLEVPRPDHVRPSGKPAVTADEATKRGVAVLAMSAKVKR